jgi:hypothetical protein
MLRLPHRPPRGRRTGTPTESPPHEPLASHALIPRVDDLGAAWAPHACRARAALPRELAWAAPLLDPDAPLPLLCGGEQARALLRWHHHLPTYAQVSLGSRLREPSPRAPAPRR